MTKPKWADLFGIDPTYTDDPTYADEVKRLRDALDDADVRERAMMRRISELEATIEQVRALWQDYVAVLGQEAPHE
jgi:hypothetical protein